MAEKKALEQSELNARLHRAWSRSRYHGPYTKGWWKAQAWLVEVGPSHIDEDAIVAACEEVAARYPAFRSYPPEVWSHPPYGNARPADRPPMYAHRALRRRFCVPRAVVKRE